MQVVIDPGFLAGSIPAICSKSMAHRYLICAALADSPVKIVMPQSSVDIDTTINCLNSLGAQIRWNGEDCLVDPIVNVNDFPLLDCSESGSTFRFLLPLVAAICDSARFSGSGRLPSRPISDLMEVMMQHNVSFSAARLPFSIEGRLSGGEYRIPGNISSQYISGLLMALPHLATDSRIILTSPLESAGYVDITLAVLRKFGLEICSTAYGYDVHGGQIIHGVNELVVEGDWSNAAFFLVAGALGSRINVRGLNTDSAQGDKIIIDILRNFGAKVTAQEGNIFVETGLLRGCCIDMKDIPDSLPVLAVLATAAEGETKFINAGRLRLKESDRLSTVAAMLKALGGDVTELADGLIVRSSRLQGGIVDSCGDHRIAMAAAVAATICCETVTINNAEAVNKSYPQFFTDFNRLGGKADVICAG